MSMSTKLGNKFLQIPKLDISGSNWVIFKEHFIWTLDARGIIEHIDGTGSEPINPMPEKDCKEVLSAENGKLDSEWKKELREWRAGEAVAKQQVASLIPDSLFLKICSNGSTFQIWKAPGTILRKGPKWLLSIFEGVSKTNVVVTRMILLHTSYNARRPSCYGAKVRRQQLLCNCYGILTKFLQSLYFGHKCHLECPGDNTNS